MTIVTAGAPLGKAIWSESGSTTPETADWFGASFGAESNSSGVGQWYTLQAAEAPTREEIIAIGVRANNDITAQIWNGTSWNAVGAPLANPLSNVDSYLWGFDVAYETTSGDALLVWNNNTTGTNSISYSIWNGVSWTPEAFITVPLAGKATQMQLAADPIADEMVLVVTNAGKQDYALVWDGNAWGNSVTLDAAAGVDWGDIAVVYEQSSGDAMVTFGKSAIDVFYRTWNGAAWSAEGTISRPGGPTPGNVLWTTLAADPEGDGIVMGVITSTGKAWVNTWNGNAWGTSFKVTDTVSVTNAPNVAVAFEDGTGTAIATYGVGTNVQYRTWTAGGGWSGELTVANVGEATNSMLLRTRPDSEEIMLAVQDAGNDLNYVRWTGSSWTAPIEQEFNTGQTGFQPFEFVWTRIANFAPVLNPAATPVLNPVMEDSLAPVGAVGTLISSLVDLNPPVGGLDNVIDVDIGAVTGVALTAVNTANGTWHYSTNGGALWNPLGAVSAANARLLAADATTRVYFQPNADFSGAVTSAITFRAWDRTGGTNGGTFDTTTNGGETPFSSATDTANITVTPANDAPTIANLSGDSLGYTAGSGALVIEQTGDALVADIDSANFDGGNLTVSIAAGGTPLQDLLSIRNQGTNPGQIGYSLGVVTFGGVNIGTATGGAGGVNLVVSLNANATPTAVTALVKNVTYENNNILMPTVGSRTIRFTVNDGDGDTSLAHDAFVNVSPGNSPPTLTSPLTPNINENGTIVQTLTASDPDGDPVTFSITGGADAARFTINPSDELVFLTAPDFELPGDADTNNVYDVIVQVSDGALIDTQAIAVTVTALNDNNPVITSNGGGATAAVNVAENTTSVTTVTATDADLPAQMLTFSISGGVDAAKFSINGSTGALSFIAAPNYEIPTDAGANNVYDVIVQVSDGVGGIDTQDIAVTVTDVSNIAVVTTTADVVNGATSSIEALNANKGTDGLISLREAILAANSTPNAGGPDVIQFDLPDNDAGHFYYRNDGVAGTLSLVAATTLADAAIADFDPDHPYAAHSWFRIDLNNALPQLEITDDVIIDGYSQAGSVQNSLAVGDNATLRIELTNTAADGNRGLTIQSGGAGSIISGLVINGFGFAGILTESGANNVTVQGNFIGTDVTGTINLGNGDDGVQLRSSGNLVGGANAADRNVLSGNASRGVSTFTAGPISTGNVIQNNYIGVDATGVGALGNGTAGVQIYNNNGLQLLGNVIAANTGNGVWLRNSSSVVNTVIRGNLIGVGADGVTALGHTANGIWIEEATSNTMIGGVLPGQGNTIANNAADGIMVDAGTGTSFRGNRIFSNGGLGIDLAANGVTGNDLLDLDGGPNGRQNFPAITMAIITASDITISGTLNSNALTSGIKIDFYWSSVGDPTGHGEGQNYIGSTTVNTDALGNASFNLPFLGANAPVGSVISATATDASGNTSEFSLNVVAVDANTPPMITSNGGGENAAVNVVENSASVTTVTATDADLPAQTLTYSISGGVDAAKFSINGSTGALSFITAPDYETPTDAGANNVYNVTVQVSDGALTDTQAIAVTVTAVNDNNPVITSSNMPNVAENQTAVVTVTATDADLPAQMVTYAITGGADSGLFTLNATTGVLTFIAAPDFEAPADADTNNVYEIEVTANDGNGGSGVQSISVTVTNVNEAPIIANLAGDTLVYGTGSGSLVIEQAADTLVTDVDSANFAGGNLTVSLAAGGVPLEDVLSLRNQGVNPGEIGFLLGAVTYGGVNIGTAVGGAAGIDLVITLNGNATPAAVTALARNITYENINLVTPTAGNRRVRFTSNDGDGATSLPHDAFVNVNISNTPPTITSSLMPAINENSTTVQLLTASDPNSDPVTFSITGGADAARFTINLSDELVFLAAPDFELPGDADTNNVYEVRVTADDGNGGTDVRVISVTITPLNDNSPVFTSSATPSIDENLTIVHTLTATDADSPAQTITFTIAGTGADDALFTVNGANQLVFLSAPDFETPLDAGADNVYNVDVRADDGNGRIVAQSMSVTVTAVNDNIPVFTSSSTPALPENQTAVMTLTGTDADLPGQAIGFSITGGADAAQFAINGANELVFQSAPDFELPADANGDNVYEVQVTADDGNGGTTIQLISVTVTPVNEEQTLTTNSPIVVNEGGTATIDNSRLRTTDVDNSPLQLVYTVTAAPNNGTLRLSGTPTASFTQDDLDNNRVSYQHNGSETTSDSFNFDVDDGQGTVSSATFTVNITPVNDEQILTTNLPLAVNEGATATIDNARLLTTDVDDTPLQLVYTVTVAPSNGTLLLSGSPTASFTQDDLDNNRVSYQHNGGETTSDSFNFDVDDGQGTVSSATFTVNITPVNDEQILTTNLPLAVNEGATATIDNSRLRTTDVDNSPLQLVYTVTAAPGNGTLLLSGTPTASFTQDDLNNNRVSYRHNGGETTSDSFNFDIDDGQGTVSSATFTVNITPVNDEQILATNLPLAVNEGASATINNARLLTTDADNAPLQLVYTVTAAPSNGTLLLSGSPTASFTQDDLNSNRVSYQHNGSETTSDSFNFDVDDGQGTVSSATFDINIAPVNDAPALGGIEVAALSYTEGDGSVRITGSLTVADVDDAVIESATIQIIGNFRIGQDKLAFADTPAIVGSWNASTGTLTLTGSDSLANYEAALRSVMYANTSVTPSTATRTVRFVVHDGDAPSNVATRNIAVASVNSVPVTNGDSFNVFSGTTLVIGLPSQGVLANDSDPESEPITAVLSTGPTKGVLVLQANGTFTYTPNVGASGADEFYYVANDGTGSSTPTRVVVTIAVVGPPGVGSGSGGEAKPPSDPARGEDNSDDADREVSPPNRGVQPPAFVAAPGNSSSDAGGGQQLGLVPPPIDDVISKVSDEVVEQGVAVLELVDNASVTASFDARDRQLDRERDTAGASDTRSTPNSDTTLPFSSVEFGFISPSGAMWQDLDEFEELIENDVHFEAMMTASTIGTTTTLSVGYVLWFLRGSYLVSCVLAQMPAWKMIDPMFVFAGDELLGDEDDESLNAMLQRSNEAEHDATTDEELTPHEEEIL